MNKSLLAKVTAEHTKLIKQGVDVKTANKQMATVAYKIGMKSKCSVKSICAVQDEFLNRNLKHNLDFSPLPKHLQREVDKMVKDSGFLNMNK